MSQTAEIINFKRQTVKAGLENGYTMFSHDIIDTIIDNQARLTAVEIRVLLAIARKTYSFHKKSDWMTNTQIMEKAKMSKGHVSNTLKSLLSKNVTFKDGKNTGINSTVSDWGVHNPVNNRSSQPSVPKFTTQCTEVHNLMNNSSQPSETQKKQETTTKETTTKETLKELQLSIISNSPSFIPEKSISEFIEHRKHIKKPMSELALSKFINLLTKHHQDGYDIQTLIDKAILSGWQTIYPKPEDKINGPVGKTEAIFNQLQEVNYDKYRI